MPLLPCPECGRQVSDLAASCPACGIQLRYPAPAAAHPHGQARPMGSWAAPRAETSPGLRAGQIAAVLFCVGFGLTTAQGENGAARLGWAVGYTLVSMLLAALFLAWSRRTRPYVPFLGVGFALLSAMGNAASAREELARGDVDREVAQTRSIVSALTDTTGSSVPAVDGSGPPRGERAVMVWAMNRALSEVPAFKQELAARHGVDVDRLPPAWGTSRYMANASAHPDVGVYWEGYRAYLTDFRREAPEWLQTRMVEHARQGGVRAAALRGYADGVRDGVARWEMDVIDRAGETVAAALEYHRFLVAADARVSYDADSDMALFDNDADLERATRLQDRVTAAADALNRAEREQKNRTMQRLDSLAARMR